MHNIVLPKPLSLSVLLSASVGFFFGYFVFSASPTENFFRYAPGLLNVSAMSKTLSETLFNDTDRQNLTIDAEILNLQKDTQSLAAKLHHSTRLLCWIMHEPKRVENREVIMETWGRRCHLTLFMIGDGQFGLNESRVQKIASNAYLINLDMSRDHYGTLWEKTRKAFTFVDQHFDDDYDWALKVDDDSYVIVDNLRLFLLDKNQNDPYYYGCEYNRQYASGGPGYILSRANVKKFIDLLRKSSCLEASAGGPEDAYIGQCLRKAGVRVGDSRDQHGRFRFSPFNAEWTLNHKTLPKKYNWFWSFTAHKLSDGFECCSDTAISFHYVTPEFMRVMEYLIYYVHPFSKREIWNPAVYEKFSSANSSQERP